MSDTAGTPPDSTPENGEDAYDAASIARFLGALTGELPADLTSAPTLPPAAAPATPTTAQ